MKINELDKIYNFRTNVKKIKKIEAFNVENEKFYCIKFFIELKGNITSLYIGSRSQHLDTIDCVITTDDHLKPFRCYIFKDGTNEKTKRAIIITLFNIDKNPLNFIKSFIKKDINESVFNDPLMYVKVSTYATLGLTMLSILMVISFYIKKSIKMKEEFMTTRLENDLNRIMFDHTKGSSKFEDYSELIYSLKTVINKNRKGLVVTGPPGTGKTFIVKREMYLNNLKPDSDYTVVKGSSLDVKSLYAIFYRYRDKIIILDDFDSPLTDPNISNLVKAATDSYPIRIISLPIEKDVSSKQGQTEREAPEKFNFRGKIIILTNIPSNQIEPAILSRLGFVEVNFEGERMLKVIDKMLEYILPHIDIEVKKEVLDYIIKLSATHKNLRIDFRLIQSAIELRTVFPNTWKDLIFKTLKRDK